MSRLLSATKVWCWLACMALLLTHAASAQQTANVCSDSDQTYANDGMLMQLAKAPTHFRLMVSRYVEIMEAARGYQCTGTASVGFDGHQYLQTGRSDDPGIMEWIPTLARWTGLTLAGAYDLTIFVTIAVGLLIGCAGLWKLFPRPGLRWICAAALLLIGLAEMRVADEYVFQVSPLVAGLPWLLYFAFARRSLRLTLSGALLSFCCSWCALMRSGTAFICLTFLVSMFALRRRVQRPFVPLLLCLLACVPAFLFEKAVVQRQAAALYRVGTKPAAQGSRPFWHTFYIGLGFLHNSEVPEYRDEVARDKVHSIDPSVAYTSSQYERILRHEVLSLLKRKPMLVAGTLAAKAGIVMLLGMVLVFPVRRLMFADRKFLWLDVAFTLTMGVSAGNSLVAVPRLSYLLTFCGLAVMYVTIKLCMDRYQPVVSDFRTSPDEHATPLVADGS